MHALWRSDLCVKTDWMSDHRHGHCLWDGKNQVSIEYVQRSEGPSSPGKSTTCPSKAGLYQLFDKKLRTNDRWSLNTDTGRQLSCKCCQTCNPEQHPNSWKDAERQSHLGKVQEGSARHLLTLDEKNEQMIFTGGALL